MHDVFVSYSQADKSTADAVVAGLEARGIRCWIASRDIAPGRSWGEAIVEAIAASTAMVLILSPSSNGSRQVIREVERAVASGIVTLPFRIEDFDPTGAMAYFLATEHWLDALTPPLERHIDRLAATVKALLGVAADVNPPPPPEPTPTRPWKPLALAGAGVAVVAIAGLAVLGSSGETTTTTTPTTTTAITTAPTTAATTTTQPQVTLTQVAAYPTAYSLGDFAVDDRNLVIADPAAGIELLSVANPATPLPMAVFGGSGSFAVDVAGGYAFVAAGRTGDPFFVVVDLRGGAILPPDEDNDALVSIANVVHHDGFAYLAGHDALAIFAVDDPRTPRLVYTWANPGLGSGLPGNVFVAGSVAYVSMGWDGVFVFDVSDPGRPREIGHLETPDWVAGVAVAGDLAFLTLGRSGLLAVDVSDPTAPRIVGQTSLPAFASPIVVGDGYAYVATFDETGVDTGVVVVDLHDPAAMMPMATIGPFTSVVALAMVGPDHLYVADEQEGLFVFEIGR